MNFKKSLRRAGVLAMALMMVFAMTVGAFASDYNVNIFKSGKSTLSMADDIIAGDATVTINDDSATIEIPIKPIKNYKPMGFLSSADGYLRSVNITGATSTSIVPGSGLYTSATLTIVIPTSYISDGRIAVSSSSIDLYNAGTSNSYWMSHISPSFDIDISNAIE